MSPRAACRLETLGFTAVYDYVPGKAAWMAAGLPVEGTVGDDQRVGSRARPDVPTCGLDEPVGQVAGRVGDWPVAVVVEGEGIVLGVVRAEDAKDAGPDPSAEVEVGAVMRPGPSTFRPAMTCEELATYLDEHDLGHTLVTTLDGVLVGLVRRGDLGPVPSS
jgi:CBS domain-containing protein